MAQSHGRMLAPVAGGVNGEPSALSLRPLLPACGEKVGDEGRFQASERSDPWHFPLTRRVSRVDLSPQAGRGNGDCGAEFEWISTLEKRLNSRLRPAQNERVNVVGALVGVDRLQVHQVAHDVEFIANTVATVHVAGHPWFFCTLWLAQWHIAAAKAADDLAPALELLRWVAAHALQSGVLAEQVDPDDDRPLSVSPLAWSHAAVIQTVVDYTERSSRFNLCRTCGQPIGRRDRATFLSERLSAIGELGSTG